MEGTTHPIYSSKSKIAAERGGEISEDTAGNGDPCGAKHLAFLLLLFARFGNRN
jgi:hypothetical protein